MAKKKMGLGVAVAAATAAAAGYYFYASKDAVKNRKIATKWAGNFKKEALKQVKGSGALDSQAIRKAVGEAQKIYQSAKGIDKKDVAKAAQELKKNWDVLAKEAEKAFKKGKKAASKKTSKK